MEMQVLNISIGEIIDLLIMLLGVAIVCIATFSYRKQNFIRLQAAHQKIDELSERMAEQEAALLRQQHLYDLDKRLATIRTQHPAPEKTWTNYNSMLQDIDAQLNNWIASFESRTQLAEREVQFCTYQEHTIAPVTAHLFLSPMLHIATSTNEDDVSNQI